MTSEWVELHEYAARRIAPSDIAIGKVQLKRVAEIANRRMMLIVTARVYSRSIVITVCLSLFIAYVGSLFIHTGTLYSLPSTYRLYIFIATLMYWAISEYYFNFIQFSSVSVPRFLAIPEDCYPKSIIDLIAEYRSGLLIAKTKKGIIPETYFESRWAILFFAGAEYKNRRNYVRPFGREAYDGDVYTKESVKFTDNVEAAKPLTKPTKPARTHRNGMTNHFLLDVPEGRLEEFLKAVRYCRKWERDDAHGKVCVVLRAARESAKRQLTQRGFITHPKMVSDSVAALREKQKGTQDFLGLSNKHGNGDSESWIDLVLRPSGEQPYSEIRKTALRFMGAA